MFSRRFNELTDAMSVTTIVALGIIILSVVGWLAYEEYTNSKNVQKSLNWPVCDGTMVQQGQSSIVSYTYYVAGKKYLSERIFYDQGETSMHFYGNFPYKIGQTVPVHYDPTHPDFSVLKTTPERGPSRVLAYLVGLYLGLCLLITAGRRVLTKKSALTLTSLILAVTTSNSATAAEVAAVDGIKQDRSLDETIEALKTDKNKIRKMGKGPLLIYTKQDKIVQSDMADVKINAYSAVLVIQIEKDLLAVYVLASKGHDQIVIGDQKLTVLPGQCAVICSNKTAIFESINPVPFVGYRNLREHSLEEPNKVFEAEFSIEPMVRVLNIFQYAAREPKLLKALKNMAKHQTYDGSRIGSFKLLVNDQLRKDALKLK